MSHTSATAGVNPPSPVNHSPGNPPAGSLFNTSVYQRGGLTLHALRLRVGDEAFYRILQTYVSRYAYRNGLIE